MRWRVVVRVVPAAGAAWSDDWPDDWPDDWLDDWLDDWAALIASTSWALRIPPAPAMPSPAASDFRSAMSIPFSPPARFLGVLASSGAGTESCVTWVLSTSHGAAGAGRRRLVTGPVTAQRPGTHLADRGCTPEELVVGAPPH